MAGFDYARSRATVARLITRFGMAGIIRRQTNTGPAYDPSVVTSDYPCKLVVFDYEDGKIDGSLIRRSDKLIYVAAEGLAITPAEADQVLAGESYSIVAIRPLSPAGEPIFYEIQART